MDPQSSTRSGRMVGIAVVAAIVTIVVDQFTKWLALDRLEVGRPVDVFWTLEWELVYNTGSAFSIGEGFGPIIGVLAIVISIVLLVMSRRAQARWLAALFGIIAGGAIGNVIDRIFRVGDCPVGDCDGFLGGAVIDFIDFNWWPVFNIADICIVVGAIVLALFGLGPTEDPGLETPGDSVPDKATADDRTAPADATNGH